MIKRSHRIGQLARGATVILLVTSPLARTLHAQQPAAAPTQAMGRIAGRVVDAETGQGLTDVGVQVVGTTIGTQSGVDGRFTLPRVPAGTVTLQLRRIGYAPKTITGIMLPADGAIEQNVTLSTASVRLGAQVVTASAERGTVSEALDKQRSATAIVNSVTAEQIQKSPDADAAQAVQRVSGVTVQDGRYVLVRGLGERYTQASLNGTRIPSPEPDRKVVPLDLFPSGLIQSITTSKTFTPDQPGDFSGASVDIQTREFPARRQFAYASSVGANDRAFGRALPYAPGVGGELLANAGAGRALPWQLGYAGNLSGSSQQQNNRYINQLRDVWRATDRSGIPNSSYSASVGGNDPILGHAVGYLLSGTYSLSQEVSAQQTRALADRGAEAGQTLALDEFRGQSARTSALWGGLLNLGTSVGARSRLAFTGTYNRTADNEARLERGFFSNESFPAEIQRLRYVQRGVGSAQLSGTHLVGERHTLDWAATGSHVTRSEPDRTELVYQIDSTGGGERLLWLANGEGAVRTFGDLTENSVESRANYKLAFGSNEQSSIRVGALARHVTRVADNRAYGILGRNLEDSLRALPPEQLFGGAYSQDGLELLDLVPLAQGGSYDASDRLLSGYAMTELALSERFHLIGGARVEDSHVAVNAVSTLGQPSNTRRHYTDVLPSLALNTRLTERQNLRASLTRTLARPEYRELADVLTRSVFNGENLRGNPNLVRTLITNADVRWEWFPNAGELLSVSLFGKQFENPIEKVYRPSSNNTTVQFVNADRAIDYGVELEARKSLGFVAPAMTAFTIFSNVTVMKSEIRLGSSEAASTNANRPMLGQSPYVLNGGVTWAPGDGRLSSTVLYNRVGPRIVAAGERPLPDVKEQARDVLDVSLRFPVFGSVSGRFDARNVLDAKYRTTQGTVTRESWLAGRVYQVGLSWKP